MEVFELEDGMYNFIHVSASTEYLVVLAEEVKEWMIENNIWNYDLWPKWLNQISSRQKFKKPFIILKDQEDALAFKLAWLN